MIKWFIMPDGELMEVEKVIEEGLLIDQYPTPYLMECASRREWNGTPSTTQLIKGTRLAYLEILVDYAIDPDDQAFMIIGSRGHAKMERRAIQRGDVAEQKFDQGEVSGVADHLEPDPHEPGSFVLDDYKVSGSFKVLKALGHVKRERPMLDEAGNPVLYKRGGKGYKAGDPRTETFYEIDPEQQDMGDWKLQLNHYRVRAEAELEIDGGPVKVSRMRIFVPVRDGGTHIAYGRGIDKKTYSIWVPRMEDEEVTAYFEVKRNALLSAYRGYQMSVEAGKDHEQAVIENAPQPCSPEEAWDGRRCEKFCALRGMCVKIGNPYLSAGTYDREEE